MFAQAVYLMFSSVYVCKETVEHLLLSSGESHHHHGDEVEDFGCVLLYISLRLAELKKFIFEQKCKAL